MQKLTVLILTDFEDDGIQTVSHPANSDELLGNILPLIDPIRSCEQLLRLLESNAAPGISPETPALSTIEAEPHLI